MEKLTMESILRYRYVSDPYFSPDGSCAAFVVQQASLEENTYHGDLYLLNADGGVRPLTSGGDATRFWWSARRTILFPALRSADLRARQEAGEQFTALYEIDPRGGEARLAFTLPFPVVELIPLEGTSYVVSALYDSAYAAAQALEGEARSKALLDHKAPGYDVIEELPFWFNGRGVINGKRTRLYLFDSATGEAQPLTGERFDVESVSVFGRKVIYTGVEFDQVRCFEVGVYTYDLDAKAGGVLVPPGAYDVSFAQAWSPDQVLMIAKKDASYGRKDDPEFFTVDLHTGRVDLLAHYGGAVGVRYGSISSDVRLGGGLGAKIAGDRCYFLTIREDCSYVRYVDKSGHISDNLTPAGSADSFDVFGDRLLCCGFYGGRIAELYENGKQLTHFNDFLSEEYSLSRCEPLRFTDPDGVEIHGWVMKPVDYEPGKKYPGILNIHGGPRCAFGDVFTHEMQVWANEGYFVFYCNPRGSDGRGDAFADIYGKYGKVDYQNVMQFTDEVLAAYPDLDPERVGVAGGSYGGFLTNWIIGHTGRFKAAVSQRSISNWTTMEYLSDIGYFFTKAELGVDTLSDAEAVWDMSPLKYAGQVSTPTLFIHSYEDFRCAYAEAVQMFSALKSRGVDSKLCLFKGENHELSRSGAPRNRLSRMREILGWMDRYLK